jgi:hypothetical protein
MTLSSAGLFPPSLPRFVSSYRKRDIIVFTLGWKASLSPLTMHLTVGSLVLLSRALLALAQGSASATIQIASSVTGMALPVVDVPLIPMRSRQFVTGECKPRFISRNMESQREKR